MKKNLTIAITVTLLTAFGTTCNAQTGQKQEENAQKQQLVQSKSCQSSVYEQNQVEQQAMFAGGMEKQIEFLLKNLKYPKEALNEGASGTVRVHFIVKTDGSLTEVKVPDSIHPALDAEVIRVVKAMPKWLPAKIKGKAVCQKAMLAIPFRL